MMDIEHARIVVEPRRSTKRFRLSETRDDSTSEIKPGWHPALAWAGGIYGAAIFEFLRPMHYVGPASVLLHERWLWDRIVVSILLLALFYAPALLAWRYAPIRKRPLRASAIWLAAFGSTLIVPWNVLGGLLNDLRIPIASSDVWMRYFGELGFLDQVPVLYGGAIVVYVYLRRLQGGQTSYRSRLIQKTREENR